MYVNVLLGLRIMVCMLASEIDTLANLHITHTSVLPLHPTQLTMNSRIPKRFLLCVESMNSVILSPIAANASRAPSSTNQQPLNLPSIALQSPDMR